MRDDFLWCIESAVEWRLKKNAAEGYPCDFPAPEVLERPGWGVRWVTGPWKKDDPRTRHAVQVEIPVMDRAILTPQFSEDASALENLPPMETELVEPCVVLHHWVHRRVPIGVSLSRREFILFRDAPVGAVKEAYWRAYHRREQGRKRRH